MDEKSGIQAPRIEWQAERLRVTSFPVETDQPIGDDWWAQLTGEQPEKKVLHPRMNGYEEEGNYGGLGSLALHVGLGRIDWHLTCFSAQEQEKDILPMIGKFQDSLEFFSRLVLRWFDLPGCPDAKRLAFGAVLLSPVEDRTAGYKQLSELLPCVEMDPESSSDFLYRINRPRQSKIIGNMKVNRLSNWSVSVWQPTALAVQPEKVTYLTGRQLFTCRVELDINTSSDYDDRLKPEDQSRVFRELVELGREIAANGDTA